MRNLVQVAKIPKSSKSIKLKTKSSKSCSYDKKLLQNEYVAEKRKSYQKVAEQLVARPRHSVRRRSPCGKSIKIGPHCGHVLVCI